MNVSQASQNEYVQNKSHHIPWTFTYTPLSIRILRIILESFFSLFQSTKFSLPPCHTLSSFSGLLKHSLTDLPPSRIALLKIIIYYYLLWYQSDVSKCKLRLPCHHSNCFNNTLIALYQMFPFLSVFLTKPWEFWRRKPHINPF